MLPPAMKPAPCPCPLGLSPSHPHPRPLIRRHHKPVPPQAGMSPLDYAAMHNNVELVKLLMDYGAKVMTVDKSPPVR